MADEQPETVIELALEAPSSGPPEPPPPPSAQQPRPQKLPGRLLQDIRARRKHSEPHTPGNLLTAESPEKPRAFLSELIQSRLLRRNRPSLTKSSTAEPTAVSPLVEEDDTPQDGTLARDLAEKVIKTGSLQKTSSSRKGAHTGPPRDRRFRLTEEALEYFQHFSHVKVRRSFPLTSIEEIKYDPDNKEPGPMVFKLIFPTHIMTLEAETKEDAEDWVKKIRTAWEMWQVPAAENTRLINTRRGPSDSILSPPPLSPTKPVKETIEEEEEGETEEGEQVGPQTVSLPPAATAPLKDEDEEPKKKGGISIRPRSRTWDPDLRRETFLDRGTYDRKRGIGRRASLFKKAVKLSPRIKKSDHRVSGPDETCEVLHEDYAMIKYPRRNWAIPSEKLFKIDNDNLQILWRRNQISPFKRSNCLSLYRILEIREGQQTAKFDKFPYDEVWGQSFSLMFEDVKKGGKYIGLTSLDLICDTKDSFNEWTQGVSSFRQVPEELRTVVPGFQASNYPFQYDNTDPTLLWLKQLWSCHSTDHELTERTAIKLARRFKATLTGQGAKITVREAHAHQYRHTHNLGNSLRWDGFVAVFSLLCGMSGRMFRLFRKYAKKHPQLGMAPDEFKAFLVSECHWERRWCTEDEIQRLIHHHDYHHRAFKKYVARNKPSDFQTVAKLLSYAGFLSFLRSKDNSAVNIEHNDVYQNMDQPMSHYFINSSHNTYLEEDQLYGHSSTDAYVRTLVQGCRCIEIDCWDDTLRVFGLGEPEPIIYHGFTLTTKLPFRDVIRTIKDYAFNFSNYPVIISIENHCSRNQQEKMVQLFQKVMGNDLVLENLVESQGRDRLPSPQELQGKILLKAAYRKLKGRPSATRKHVRTDYDSLERSRNTTMASHSSFEGSDSLRSPRSPQGRVDSITTDPDSDVGEQKTIWADQDPDVSVAIIDEQNSSEIYISRKQVKQWGKQAKQGEQEQYRGDQQEVTTIPDLLKLIPYCRAVSIKPWDWDKQLQTTVSEMFSFGEVSANKHCESSPEKLLACSERQLVRTYPKGSRIDSSNYDPISMWNCGIHMVALNWQYPDVFMHLNQGLFRRNGGCGYVLKPEVMRRPDPAGGSTPYLPTMTEPHPDVTPVDLEIELLSGQRLCFWKKKCSTLTVEIHTYGIPHDTDKMQPPATAQDNNTFWPQWREQLHVYEKKILMPELCLVYFRVDVVLKGPGLGAKSQLYGQNCISLVSLMPGIKFIPLRTPGGELIPESGLFVRIKKKTSPPTRQDSVSEDSPQMNRSETLDRSDSTEEYFGDINVTESIHPSLLRQRMSRQSADDYAHLDSARPLSSPPTLESHLEAIEEEGSWKSQLDKLVRESRSSGRERQLDVIAEIHGGEDESASAAANKVITVSIEPQGSFETGDKA